MRSLPLACLIAFVVIVLAPGCAAIHPIHGIPVEQLMMDSESRTEKATIDLSLLVQSKPDQYRMGTGDVLSVYIPGVLGTISERDDEIGQTPPINQPQNAVDIPTVGFPLTVRGDGTLPLPQIDPIYVSGMTLGEVERAILRAYTEQTSVLNSRRARVIVSLARPREYEVLVVRQEKSTEVAQSGPGSVNIGQSRRGTARTVRLPAYQNDVLHALAKEQDVDGLPGLDAENTIYIIRRRNRGDAWPASANGACDPSAPCGDGNVPPVSYGEQWNGPNGQPVAPMYPTMPLGQFSPVVEPGIRTGQYSAVPAGYSPLQSPSNSGADGFPQAPAGVYGPPSQSNTPGIPAGYRPMQLQTPSRTVTPFSTVRGQSPRSPWANTRRITQPPIGHAVESAAYQQQPNRAYGQQQVIAKPPVGHAAASRQNSVSSGQNYATPTSYGGGSPHQMAAEYEVGPGHSFGHSAYNVAPSDAAALGAATWQETLASFDPTVENPHVIKIPIRLSPGQRPNFDESDIILQDGDIVFIESRDTEVFYTAGLLGGGQWELPRDYDLRLLEAISIAQGPQNVQGTGNANGRAAINGDVTVSGSHVVILRTLPGGSRVPISTSIYKAIRNPDEHNIRILPGDMIYLQYTCVEGSLAFLERHLLETALFGFTAGFAGNN